MQLTSDQSARIQALRNLYAATPRALAERAREATEQGGALEILPHPTKRQASLVLTASKLTTKLKLMLPALGTNDSCPLIIIATVRTSNFTFSWLVRNLLEYLSSQPEPAPAAKHCPPPLPASTSPSLPPPPLPVTVIPAPSAPTDSSPLPAPADRPQITTRTQSQIYCRGSYKSSPLDFTPCLCPLTAPTLDWFAIINLTNCEVHLCIGDYIHADFILGGASINFTNCKGYGPSHVHSRLESLPISIIYDIIHVLLPSPAR